MSTTPDARPGLRERKKARTREAIRSAAMRLFREHGYVATTVEQIAEAAEVSPSTFFRYFPTKDALVVTDEFDPILIESLRTQPGELTVLQAFRAAYRETFRDLTDEQVADQEARMALVLEHPPLRAAMLDALAESMGVLGGLIAERTGRPTDDPEVLALVGAIIGVAISVLTGARDLDGRAQIGVFAVVLERLETGFTL